GGRATTTGSRRRPAAAAAPGRAAGPSPASPRPWTRRRAPDSPRRAGTPVHGTTPPDRSPREWVRRLTTRSAAGKAPRHLPAPPAPHGGPARRLTVRRPRPGAHASG